MKPAPLPPGIRRHGAGYQVTAHARGVRAYGQFDRDATLAEMIEWQKDERAKLQLAHPKPRGGTFAADAAKYLKLPSVQALTDYAQRQQHIQEWCAVFGGRRRRTIDPALIEIQRDTWLTVPRAVADDGTVRVGPYSAGSVNKRLRALSNLWTKLDGRRAYNPVLEVDECAEPDPEARGLPYEVIEAILAAIPDTAVGVKKDGTRTTGKNVARPSQTKARLRVIAYTGLAHAQVKLLTPADVDLEAGTVRVVARRKGRRKRGAHDRPIPTLLPLIPPAVEAFKTFAALNCWGPFSNSSMWKAFQRACKTLRIEGLRPYDFRHSLLTAIYEETRDLRVTGRFGGHRTERTTGRYTLAAVAPHVQAAADKLGARFGVGAQIGAHGDATPRNLAQFSEAISTAEDGPKRPESS